MKINRPRKLIEGKSITNVKPMSKNPKPTINPAPQKYNINLKNDQKSILVKYPTIFKEIADGITL